MAVLAFFTRNDGRVIIAQVRIGGQVSRASEFKLELQGATSEQINGWEHRYYRKGTDCSAISDMEGEVVRNCPDNGPRKRRGYAAPPDVCSGGSRLSSGIRSSV